MFNQTNEFSTELENKQENGEFLPENQRFLQRTEEEFMQDILISEYIKSFLETLVCNSLSVLITLWCIHISLGVLAAGLAGFSIGSFSGVKDVLNSTGIGNNEDTIQISGKFMKGVLKILFAAMTIFSVTGEWRTIEYMASQAAKYYYEDVRRYENNDKEGISPELKFIILIGLGSVGGVFLYQLIRDKIRE